MSARFVICQINDALKTKKPYYLRLLQEFNLSSSINTISVQTGKGMWGRRSPEPEDKF